MDIGSETAMTDTTTRGPDTPPGEQAGEPPAPAAEALATADSAPDAAALAQEAADLRDRLLRALAEMENLRRRTEREVADTRAYGIAAFARDLLPIADNIHRALDAPDLRANTDPATKAFVEGIDLTERELLKVLEKHGVTKLEPEGQRFDPNMHQAMYEVPDPSVPSGTVVQVVQPGYRIGERVLRPALVAVAKGGAKPPPREAPANDNADAQVDPPESA
jgi:molecular chaperone GrpE